MKIFYKNQIYFLSLLISFNSFTLANEDSIENLLDDMKNKVAELENEYYFVKNYILSPANDVNTNYEEFYILDGQLIDKDNTKFNKGDFVSYKPGTCHSSYTKTGCKLLVFMRKKNKLL